MNLTILCWRSAVLYLRQFTRTADILSRQRLRSSTTDSLFVPAFRLSIVGRHAFPVAGACILGTIYLLTLPPHRLCIHLSND